MRGLAGALAAAICLTGCQSVSSVRMYAGPDLPPGQLTTLVVPWCIRVRAVDGVSVPWTLADGKRVLLKPGAHTVDARYEVIYPTAQDETEKIASRYVRLTFNGEAGKTYFLCSQNPRSLEETRLYAFHVSLWIADTAAGSRNGPAAETSTPSAAP